MGTRGDLAVADQTAVAAQSAGEVKARVQRVQEIMASVMKADVHYGAIVKDGRQTLYKAGSEVLLMAFGIACKPRIEDLSTADEIRYRITAVGEHIQTGAIVGEGVGEASTGEEKYRWRAAVCDEEYDETPDDRRRLKYGWKWGERRGEKVTTRTQQVRTAPSDLANTILKMAKKRAQIDMTLTALACSDIFDQDLEDLDENMRAALVGDDPRKIKPRTQAPTSSKPASVDRSSTPSAGPDPADREFAEGYDRGAGEPRGGGGEGDASRLLASGKQLGLVKARLLEARIPTDQLLDALGIEGLEELKRTDVDRALAWIKRGGEGKIE